MIDAVAGTSGRIGVQDGSELLPSYGSPPIGWSGEGWIRTPANLSKVTGTL